MQGRAIHTENILQVTTFLDGIAGDHLRQALAISLLLGLPLRLKQQDLERQLQVTSTHIICVSHK